MTKAWISWVEEDDATGEVAAMYEKALSFFHATSVPPVIKIMSIRPEVALAVDKLRSTMLFDGSSLGARTADLIGVAVSGTNHCSYCGTAHAGLLVSRGDFEESEAVALYRDWRSVQLSPREHAILTFAEKLTLTPSEMEEADVQTLRDAELTDENIFDVVLLTAYRNFLNRINDGLGVPRTGHLEEHFGDHLLGEIMRES